MNALNQQDQELSAGKEQITEILEKIEDEKVTLFDLFSSKIGWHNSCLG